MRPKSKRAKEAKEGKKARRAEKGKEAKKANALYRRQEQALRSEYRKPKSMVYKGHTTAAIDMKTLAKTDKSVKVCDY